MTDEIKPRIDEDGVGWCDSRCPQLWSTSYPDLNTESECHIDGRIMCDVEVCPIHARRMAQEMNRLMDVAREWWLMKRPVSWDEKDHTFTPEVNCCTRAEENLAEVVADLIHDYPGKDGGE